jgi:hypothetical protein
MLIDSGADITLLPSKSIEALNLSTDGNLSVQLEGFNGTRTTARGVHLDLNFLGKVFRGRFLLIDQEFGILGRNILNHFSLLMDGPNLMWREQSS